MFLSLTYYKITVMLITLSIEKTIIIIDVKIMNETDNMKALRFDLHHLRAFKVLSHQLHFKKTADILCITQPALSRLIKSLEEALDVPLFIRNTRQVQLTVAGELFFQEVELIFKKLYHSIDLVKKANVGFIGRLKVGYNDFAIHEVLPKIIKAFQQHHTDIKIDLIYMPTSRQISAAKCCEIDIGFLLSYGSPLADLQERRLKKDRTIVVVAKNHRLAKKTMIDLPELADENFILGTESDWLTWRNYFFSICLQAGFFPGVVQEVSSSSGIMSLVAANMGIAVLSRSLGHYLPSELVAIDLACSLPDTFISAVSSANNHNPCLELFLAWLDERMLSETS